MIEEEMVFAAVMTRRSEHGIGSRGLLTPLPVKQARMVLSAKNEDCLAFLVLVAELDGWRRVEAPRRRVHASS